MSIKVTKKEFKMAMDEQLKSLNEQLENSLNKGIGTYEYSEYIDCAKKLTRPIKKNLKGLKNLGMTIDYQLEK